MLVIDGHLDLAMNALQWNRDLRLGALETRKLEAGMAQKGRAAGAVGLPDLRTGNVAICFATAFARVAWPGSGVDGYRTQEIAYAHARGHLAYYGQLEATGALRLVASRSDIEQHLADWTEPVRGAPPLGIVIAMEGADAIVDPSQVPEWWGLGLRIVSLSHYGFSAYSHGTGNPGGLLPRAGALLEEMEQIGMVLDVSHLAERAFYEALETFGGQVLASHNNCQSLVPGDRQLSDDMIRLLVQRNAVIGAAMDTWMLYPGWVKGETSRDVVSLEDYVNHVDHVCQVAGNARHAAIGTDLDGGYGTEQCPRDLDTIADLQKIPDILRARGYGEDDVRSIMYGNWARLLRESLPSS